MTREEAIKYLIKPVATSTEIGEEKQKEFEAYDMGIEALSAEAVQEWIPVSVRLPSEDGEYIVTMGKDVFDREGKVTWAMFDKLKKGFYFPAGRVKYYIAVTAWIPLPEPYRGGVKECG